MFLVSSCSCLCPIHWSHVLSPEWRCSWSSADRRCSNYIWVINNFIAFWGVAYIIGLMVLKRFRHNILIELTLRLCIIHPKPSVIHLIIHHENINKNNQSKYCHLRWYWSILREQIYWANCHLRCCYWNILLEWICQVSFVNVPYNLMDFYAYFDIDIAYVLLRVC